MDILALEYLSLLSAAQEELESGADPQLLTKAADDLRVFDPSHELLTDLYAKVATLRAQDLSRGRPSADNAATRWH